MMDAVIMKISRGDFPVKMFFIEATGFSMWPFLRPGDGLICRQTPCNMLKTGDIIVYRDKDLKISHRIRGKMITKEGCMLYTRGDNASGPCDVIAGADIEGKVVAVTRGGKTKFYDSLLGAAANKAALFSAPLLRISFRVAYGVLSYIKRFV